MKVKIVVDVCEARHLHTVIKRRGKAGVAEKKSF